MNKPPIFKETAERSTWVDKTLASLTIEEKIAQLLFPSAYNLADESTGEKWKQIIGKVPIGGIYIARSESQHILKFTRAIQRESKVPVIVAGDLENGPGSVIMGRRIDFPHPMACGAADDETLAYRMGEASALDGRAHGIHWSFAPVVDLSLNFKNPIANVRSLGEEPERVKKLAVSIMKGMQDNGMVATAKHFPGDGVDDRDQHFCTSINSLSREEWFKVYGQVWKDVFEAGVLSVMVGHVALPFMDNERVDNYGPMPATASYRIQTQLLREELGFEGLVVSDAQLMNGLSSRLSLKERVVQNILTGSDMAHAVKTEQAFQALRETVKEGKLSEERINESVRRILRLKAWLGLNKSREPLPMPSEEKQSEWAKASLEMARKSIVIVRNFDGRIPLKAKPGATILTVTLTYGDRYELDTMDSLLKQHGFRVTHLRNPRFTHLAEEMSKADIVLLNYVILPHLMYGTVNLVGGIIEALWDSPWKEHPGVVFSSFGNPYHLYELPAVPNWVNVYSPVEVSQKAFVEVLLGERKETGKSPVVADRWM